MNIQVQLDLLVRFCDMLYAIGELDRILSNLNLCIELDLENCMMVSNFFILSWIYMVFVCSLFLTMRLLILFSNPQLC